MAAIMRSLREAFRRLAKPRPPAAVAPAAPEEPVTIREINGVPVPPITFQTIKVVTWEEMDEEERRRHREIMNGPTLTLEEVFRDWFPDFKK